MKPLAPRPNTVYSSHVGRRKADKPIQREKSAQTGGRSEDRHREAGTPVRHASRILRDPWAEQRAAIATRRWTEVRPVAIRLAKTGRIGQRVQADPMVLVRRTTPKPSGESVRAPPSAPLRRFAGSGFGTPGVRWRPSGTCRYADCGRDLHLCRFRPIPFLRRQTRPGREASARVDCQTCCGRKPVSVSWSGACSGSGLRSACWPPPERLIRPSASSP